MKMLKTLTILEKTGEGYQTNFWWNKERGKMHKKNNKIFGNLNPENCDLNAENNNIRKENNHSEGFEDSYSTYITNLKYDQSVLPIDINKTFSSTAVLGEHLTGASKKSKPIFMSDIYDFLDICNDYIDKNNINCDFLRNILKFNTKIISLKNDVRSVFNKNKKKHSMQWKK